MGVQPSNFQFPRPSTMWDRCLADTERFWSRKRVPLDWRSSLATKGTRKNLGSTAAVSWLWVNSNSHQHIHSLLRLWKQENNPTKTKDRRPGRPSSAVPERDLGFSHPISLNNNMVYYFTSNVVSPSACIYVGKDKVESMRSSNTNLDNGHSVYGHVWYSSSLGIDEELIRHGLEEDVW